MEVENLKGASLCVTVVILLLVTQNIPVSVNGQEIEPKFVIRDTFSFECNYDLERGYGEIFRNHVIDIEFSNLASGVHKISTVLKTKENLVFVRTLCSVTSPPTNSSQNGQIEIDFSTSDNWCRLLIGLNETQKPVDPLNLSSLPNGQEMHILEDGGRLPLAFWFNISDFVDSCTFVLSPQDNFKIEHVEFLGGDLQVQDVYYGYSGGASFWIGNVSAGNRNILINTLVSSLRGIIDLEVSAAQKKLSMPIECFVDDNPLVASKLTIITYRLGDVKFSKVEQPFYYYLDESSYCLKFTAPKNFVLRMDASSREEIDYIILDMLPQDFTVLQTILPDETCYQFTFTASSTSNCCLGLNLKSKGWFISPENMDLSDIPAGIKEKYLNPLSSQDGVYFDINNQFVQQWAKQIAKNRTNPFVVAFSIFQNLTTTLHYPPDWRDLEEKGAFNESVREILQYKNGVCRHYARAYVALCICSGVPARTVIGTAFSFLNETYKKNHEWAEVYFPGVGWVTIDPAWGQFCLLCNRHAKSTYWTYIENSLKVTNADNTFRTEAKEKSKILIMHLIESCRQLLNVHAPNSIKTETVEVMLDKAGNLAENGLVYDALLYVAKAHILITASSPGQLPVDEPACIFVLGLAILFVALFCEFHKIDAASLKPEKNLEAFIPQDIEKRKLEYKTLNELVNTRENSSAVFGSIFSAASFLILTTAVQISSDETKFFMIVAAILLEGCWLCYYHVTSELDHLCYDLLRKLEKSLKMEVHQYLRMHQEKSMLMKARKYVWIAAFTVLWIAGIILII